MDQPEFVSLRPVASERVRVDEVFDALAEEEQAAPVMIGRQREPEAVLISLWMFRVLTRANGFKPHGFVSLLSPGIDRVSLGAAFDDLGDMTAIIALFVGRYDHAEAALLSFGLYWLLADRIDELLLQRHIAERLAVTAAAGGPYMTTVEALARSVGVDLDTLPDIRQDT